MKSKRRQYYSLIDKVYEMNNLQEAWLSIKKDQGSGSVDGVSIGMYEKKVSTNVRELQRLLQQGRTNPIRYGGITSRRRMESSDHSAFPRSEIEYVGKSYGKSSS
ncbi:hypothetical protein [Paenibacillus monticola]|uniref:Uncharacterized protein n=1 Tax=Paenibacillus monticola TaxID=2666075 RepID=A0A7X2H414_9BACL|nr:hypothetical protein [Paenibacillus monticola]MRN53111.1 hypothetical protein [Paenibacillus monticola]